MGRFFNKLSSRLFSLRNVGALTLMALSGCGIIEPEKAPPACPEIIALKEAQEMTRFVGQGRDLTDVTFEASINNFAGKCILDDETNNLTNQVVIRFELTEGPASDGAARFNYFVAVATLDRKILSRESFDLVAPFEGNTTTVALIDNVYPTIPLRRGETGEDYIIFIGFELTRGELYYNRTKL